MTQLQALYQAAQEWDIEVLFLPMNGITALATPDNCIVLDPARLQSDAEEALCLAHEMGHCRTGAFYRIDTPPLLRNRQEERARRWAIVHLLPWETLRAAMEQGIDTPFALAQHFSLPEAFIQQAVDYYRQVKGL